MGLKLVHSGHESSFLVEAKSPPVFTMNEKHFDHGDELGLVGGQTCVGTTKLSS